MRDEGRALNAEYCEDERTASRIPHPAPRDLRTHRVFPYNDHSSEKPTEGPNPDMIQLFKLTPTICRITPLAWMLLGVVRPGTRISGVYDADARGRAP